MSTTVFYGYIGDDAETVYNILFGDDDIKEVETTYEMYDVSFNFIITDSREGYWICYINDIFVSMHPRYDNSLTATLSKLETDDLDLEFYILVSIPPEIHIIAVHSDNANEC